MKADQQRVYQVVGMLEKILQEIRHPFDVPKLPQLIMDHPLHYNTKLDVSSRMVSKVFQKLNDCIQREADHLFTQADRDQIVNWLLAKRQRVQVR